MVTTPTHGGKRPGAGRKPATEPRTARSIRMTDAQWLAFQSFGGARWLLEQIDALRAPSDER